MKITGMSEKRTIAEKLENRGIEKGIERGIEHGIEHGIERGRLLTICSLVKKGVLSMENAADFLGITVKELEEKMSEIEAAA